MNSSSIKMESIMMADVNGTRIHPGDRVITSTNGEVSIRAALKADDGHGALVRCTDGKGHRVDLRLLLSGAKLVREHSERR
jgi:hypothetical protein